MSELILLISIPLIFALLSLICNRRRLDVILLPLGALIHLGFTIYLFGKTNYDVDSWLKLDRLGWIFLLLLSLLFLASALYSADYLPRANAGKAEKRSYAPYLFFSLAAMTGVITSNHLGLMWVFIEATTLLTAPLIIFQKNRYSLEASWKYLFICSVGIAFAFIGLLFLALAGSRQGHTIGLLLSELLSNSLNFNPLWLKIAFVFIVGGYGAKAGLAPLHTWLPDAHSQAPSPVSAILSGTLLNCALFGILRFYQVLAPTSAYTFARGVLLVTGMLSVFVCAVYILRLNDYKRVLAYSSMENMGIIVIGVALGGYGLLGAMIHIVCHSLTKSAMFLTSGNILHHFGSKQIEKVKGVLRTDRPAGVLWLGGILALTAVPPFATFFSELLIMIEMLKQRQIWLFILFTLMLTIVLAGLFRVSFQMILGTGDGDEGKTLRNSKRTRWLTEAPAFVFLLSVLLISVSLLTPALGLFKEAAVLLGGGL